MEAIRSASMNSGAEAVGFAAGFVVVIDGVGVDGAVVLRRRISRTWEPVGERASWMIGGSSCEGVEGKRRLLMSFRRKRTLLEVVGKSPAWMM